MYVLGISALYHDSAACLLRDGEIVAAAQEERFTRKKHDARFPEKALAYCLAEGGIGPEALDYVAFYDKPILKFDRLLETYLSFAPEGYRAFLTGLPVWLQSKLHLPRELDRGFGHRFRGRYVFPEHHESHAASAFFPSPFQEAAIMTLDGVGEWATTTLGVGRGRQIELTHEQRFPHSLGLLYSAFTYFTGFKVNSGEYKLMGLAPYGRPRFAKVILDQMVNLKADGSFRLDLSYFNYCQGLTMTSPRMEQLLEGPPRRAEDQVTQREMDLAASIQEVTEEIMLRSARFLARETGLENLCLAGGVALNCVGNGRILRDGCFKRLWIQPAAGDAGGALGSALFVWHQLLERPRPTPTGDAQRGSLLGPRFSAEQIRPMLDAAGAKYLAPPNEGELLAAVVKALVDEKVVGFFQGRMEFGPRALGGRSILGDPRSPRMQSQMNLKIKFRESFRPFAPSVLLENAPEWFDLQPGTESPYMLLVAPVKEARRLPPAPNASALFGIELLNLARSTIPTVTHVDYSARVQTVDGRNGRYQRLIEKFREATGCPVLVNTSFNIRGEPIVCTPADAYRCFMACDMDVLVLEDFVLYKSEQPAMDEQRKAAYKAQFELD